MLAFIPMGMPGHMELFLIFFVILLLFGGKKLPQLARGLGASLNEFKKGKAEFDKAKKEIVKEVEEVKGLVEGK